MSKDLVDLVSSEDGLSRLQNAFFEASKSEANTLSLLQVNNNTVIILSSSLLSPSALRSATERPKPYRKLQVSGADSFMLRKDIVYTLETALGRAVEGMELVAILRCFDCETEVTVGLKEFMASATRLRELLTMPCAFALKSKRRPSEIFPMNPLRSPQKEVPSFLENTMPRTANQEIGWHAAIQGPSPSSRRKHYPLKGSDVTKGNEGRSLKTFYPLGLA